MYIMAIYLEEFVRYWLMDTVTRVQILNDIVSISHSANTLRKGMDPVIFPLDMGK